MESHDSAADHRDNSPPLERRVESFLLARGVPGVGEIQIDADGDTIVLQGRIASVRARWLCLECCRRVAGVVRIEDKLRVDPAATNRPRRPR